MEAETYIAIDRYLANEMETEERLVFEERLHHDPILAEKVNLYRSASETLKAKFQREEKEAMFKHTLAKIAAEKPAIKAGKVVKLNWYAWAAAASVAILCAALFYTSFSKPDYSDFAKYEPIALVERGQNDSTKLQAQKAFNNHEYMFATLLFTKLLERDSKNVEIELYKGIALLELNRITEANEMFNEVRRSESVYKYKAVWMLALSALKQKDYEKCELFLKEIPKDSPEYEEAQRLMDRLWSLPDLFK